MCSNNPKICPFFIWTSYGFRFATNTTAFCFLAFIIPLLISNLLESYNLSGVYKSFNPCLLWLLFVKLTSSAVMLFLSSVLFSFECTKQSFVFHFKFFILSFKFLFVFSSNCLCFVWLSVLLFVFTSLLSVSKANF